MTLKEKANKKRAQKKERSVISDSLAEQAKEKVNSGTASINAGATSLPSVAGYADPEAKPSEASSPLTSIAPQTTGVTAPEMANPVKATAQARLETPSFSDLLANSMSIMRQNAEKEKTDAAKMQQYYAFADALNAIGKLGGSAVGGAIGGNVADSAPAVDPYKESRGYLAAFEKAKAANERLKGLDDKAFSLAVSQEERDYNRKVREADNAFKMRLTMLDQQWQKNFYDYKSKIEQAAAQGNLQLKAELEAKQKEAEQAYWKERAAISHGYNKELKKMSEDIVRLQMGLGYGDDGKALGKTTPFTFSNGTKVDIPKTLFPEMLKYFAKKGINGQGVDAEDVESALRDHPELVNSFLRIYGYGTPVTEAENSDTPYYPFFSFMPEDLRKTAYQTGSAEGGTETNPDEDFLNFKRPQ